MLPDEDSRCFEDAANRNLTVRQMYYNDYTQLFNAFDVLRRIRHVNLASYYVRIKGLAHYIYFVAQKPRRDFSQDIEEKMKKQKAFRPAFLARVFCQIVAGLKALHSKGFVHGDLRPENVLFYKSGDSEIVCLSNYCLVNHALTADRVEMPYELLYFHPPEVFNGGTYDTAGDLWQVGVLLYYVCAFRYPFAELSSDEFVASMRFGRALKYPERIDQRLQRLISLLLAWDPRYRPYLDYIFYALQEIAASDEEKQQSKHRTSAEKQNYLGIYKRLNDDLNEPVGCLDAATVQSSVSNALFAHEADKQWKANQQEGAVAGLTKPAVYDGDEGRQRVYDDSDSTQGCRTLILDSPSVKALNAAELQRLLFLDISGSQIEQLDCRQLRDLIELVATNSWLREIQLCDSGDDRSPLRFLTLDGSRSLKALDCAKLGNLCMFSAAETRIENLDVSSMEKLQALDVSTAGLTRLEIGNLKSLKSVMAYINELSEIDVEQLQELRVLGISANPRLKELETGNLKNLRYLKIFSTGIKSFDTTQLGQLIQLHIDNNPQITELHTAPLKRLRVLYAYNTSIVELDTRSLTYLCILSVGATKIYSLDISPLQHVQELYLNHLQIYHIDTRNAHKLRLLHLYKTLIRAIDCRPLAALVHLDVSGTAIKFIDLKSAPFCQSASLHESYVYKMRYQPGLFPQGGKWEALLIEQRRQQEEARRALKAAALKK